MLLNSPNNFWNISSHQNVRWAFFAIEQTNIHCSAVQIYANKIFNLARFLASNRSVRDCLEDRARKQDGGYWRASRIGVLLANPIYRGEFVWHGSSTYKHRATKRGDTIKLRQYARPELRLVSDELWKLCNARKQTRSKHGGGKNALAGLLTCGCCGGTLVLTAHARSKSLYCTACTTAKACARKTGRLSVTVATKGVRTLLT